MTRVHIMFEGKDLTQSKFNEIEQKVLEYFHNLWSDILDSILAVRKVDQKFVKSELCLALISADTLSRFAEIITTGDEQIGPGKNEKRFRSWMEKYVLTDQNDTYKVAKKEINCDSFILWKIRNSLLHFYGLPLLETEHIVFSQDQILVGKISAAIAGKSDKKRARAVDPYQLINAIRDGFLTQLIVFSETIKGSDDSKKEIYIRGIVKIYDIVKNEGTVFVPFKQAQ